MLILKRQFERQPQGPARIASALSNGVHVTYPVGAAWLNARNQRITGTRGFYAPSISRDGVVWAPNTNSKTIDLGIPKEPTYAVLMVIDVRVAALTSASLAFNLLAPSEDYALTSGDIVRAGSSTGLVTGETLVVSDSATSNRTGMTDTLAVGRHVVCLQWDVALGKYRWWLNGALATPVETATPSSLKSFGGYFTGRVNSGQAHMCPALVVISHDASTDLTRYMAQPWAMLERSIYIPTAAAAGSAPSITALSAISITATSAQPRISYS